MARRSDGPQKWRVEESGGEWRGDNRDRWAAGCWPILARLSTLRGLTTRHGMLLNTFIHTHGAEKITHF